MSDQQAVRRVGPAPSGSTEINRAFRTAAAVDGSALWQIPSTGLMSGNGGCFPGCWVTVTNIGQLASDLMVVNFWSTVTGLAHANALSATDFVVLPGQTQEFWCNSGINQMKIGGPVTAIASHYRSSL